MLPQLDLSTLKPCTSLEREILQESDLDSWKQSLPFEWMKEYIEELMRPVQREVAEASGYCRLSPAIGSLRKFLDEVQQLVQDAPTFERSNQKHAFSAFRSKLGALAASLHFDILPTFLHANVVLPELHFHLLRSFGSQTRLDYGTGHELSFIFYLLCLRLTGVLSELDSKETVDEILPRYWNTAEQGRKKFGLVIAGRRGIWKKDEATGKLWFDAGASEARARSKSSSSLSSPSSRALRVNESSTSLHLLRSLLASSASFVASSVSSESGASTPNSPSFNPSRSPSSACVSDLSIEPENTPSPKSSPRSRLNPLLASPSKSPAESRQDLFRLYLSTVLTCLPCLLHLRFGSILPFATSGSPDQSSELLKPLPSSRDRFPPRHSPPISVASTDSDAGPISVPRPGRAGGEVPVDNREEENIEWLEILQNQREGFESTVAPWNVPQLSGQESFPT